jgi:hypothetical protein
LLVEIDCVRSPQKDEREVEVWKSNAWLMTS